MQQRPRIIVSFVRSFVHLRVNRVFFLTEWIVCLATTLLFRSINSLASHQQIPFHLQSLFIPFWHYFSFFTSLSFSFIRFILLFLFIASFTLLHFILKNNKNINLPPSNEVKIFLLKCYCQKSNISMDSIQSMHNHFKYSQRNAIHNRAGGKEIGVESLTFHTYSSFANLIIQSGSFKRMSMRKLN